MTVFSRKTFIKATLPGVSVIMLLLLFPLFSGIFTMHCSCCADASSCCSMESQCSECSNSLHKENTCNCSIHKCDNDESLIYIEIKNIKETVFSSYSVVVAENHIAEHISLNILREGICHLKFIPFFLTNSSLLL